MKHILVISQYFYPEQFRINDICLEWVNRGYRITVLTGIPNYPQGCFYPGYGFFKKRIERFSGIDIIRIPIIPRGNNSLMLIMNYISFVISGYLWGLFTNIKADYVFVFEVSPMTQALPGVWYSKLKKIPCYLYVQDLWPENVEIITGIKSRTILRAIGKMVDYIYRNCDRIFTSSRSFVHAISSRGINESKIYFWPQYSEDYSINPNLEETSKYINANFFNIVFAGNIGVAQGLDILINAATKIIKKNRLDIRFNIIGDGRYLSQLKQKIKEEMVEGLFNFIPKQKPEIIPSLLFQCDVAFLSLADNHVFTMTIPAKLQTYMACGIPCLASAKGETEEIIRTSNGGLVSNPEDLDEFVQNILIFADMNPTLREKMGQNAAEYAKNNFNKKKLMDWMDQFYN